jgi:hypothetical protein
LLDQCDLIVCATADWGTQVALESWVRARDVKKKILHGWTEPHASAGHAAWAAIGTLEHGFDSTGRPRFAVTDWPDQNLQEPACGANFQPYGAAEMANTVTLVATLALEVGDLSRTLATD